MAGFPWYQKRMAWKTISQFSELRYKKVSIYCCSECDLAASLLPVTYASGGGDIGRATKGAALALKSRMLLYAASELYNNPSWAAGYSNPELISVTGDRTAKWQAAKACSKGCDRYGNL